MADFLLGGGLDADVMRRSIELERPRREVPIEWRPSMVLGMMLSWSGDGAAARRCFDDLHRRARAAGDETSLPFLLAQMSETATWAGDWPDALRLADEAHALALQTGQDLVRASVLYARGLVQAHLGSIDEARASAREGLRLSEQVGSVVAMMQNQSVLGVLEISLDDPAGAHEHLGPLVAVLDVVGIREPGVVWFVPDEVEALIGLGQLQRADELLTSYEGAAARRQRAPARLAAARVRARLTAAGGDSLAAAASLSEALADLAARVPPFDRARALLALGAVQRRTRQKRAARTSLETALDGFQRLGAAIWAARAMTMLGRGEAQVGREPGAGLTPAERRVVDLVIAGGTNREIADRLFVSVRGVEVHLTSAYRKLGVRSRTELAARMRDASPPEDAETR